MNKKMLLVRNDALLFVIDPQAKLIEMVQNSEKIIQVHNKVIRAAQILNIPIVVTEHYPKGLGTINPKIIETLGDDYKPLEKIIFSAFADEKIKEAIISKNKKMVMVIGIETHICILQTVLELIDSGFDVFVVEDAVSARGETEHKSALKVMQNAGAIITTWESAIYQLMRRADIPEFKNVLPLLKD